MAVCSSGGMSIALDHSALGIFLHSSFHILSRRANVTMQKAFPRSCKKDTALTNTQTEPHKSMKRGRNETAREKLRFSQTYRKTRLIS